MNHINITYAINSLSIPLSKKLSNEEIDLVAAIFTQLGDTLATISTSRIFNNKSKTTEEI